MSGLPSTCGLPQSTLSIGVAIQAHSVFIMLKMKMLALLVFDSRHTTDFLANCLLVTHLSYDSDLSRC